MIFLNVKFIGFNYMEIHSPLNATKFSVIVLQNTAERTESLIVNVIIACNYFFLYKNLNS